MNFPDASVDLARKTIEELPTGSAYERAVGLYKYLDKRNFRYGISEGLESGKFIRWPHELDEEWECIEAAQFTYLLAREMGLNPTMYQVQNWQRRDTGHETVSVQTEKGETLVDVLNTMFGRVHFFDKGLVVEDNDVTVDRAMPCDDVRTITEDEMITRTHYYRSDEGTLNVLECGQTVNSNHVSIGPCSSGKVFIHYDPKEGVLSFEYRNSIPFLPNTYFRLEEHYKSGRVVHEHGIFQRADWVKLVGRQRFARKVYQADTLEPHGLNDCLSHLCPPENTFLFSEDPHIGEYGILHLMNTDLYFRLLAEVNPETNQDTEASLVFEYRGRPADLLEQRIAALEAQQDPRNIPLLKQLKLDAEIHTITEGVFFSDEYEGFSQQLHMFNDMATLSLTVQSAARELGEKPIDLYTRLLEDFGLHTDVTALLAVHGDIEFDWNCIKLDMTAIYDVLERLGERPRTMRRQIPIPVHPVSVVFDSTTAEPLLIEA